MRFIKAQASSLVATGVDFLIVILLSEAMGAWSIAANMAGTIAGGITNFLINRKWVFRKEYDAVSWQAVKYVIVWTGNLIFNAAGVWALTNYTHCSYIPAKIIVSLFMGIGYNYLMQKRFVFK